MALPVMPAVTPAAIVPAIAPATVVPAVAPAAVVPTPAAIVPTVPAVTPPGELGLGVDGDERLTVLGVLRESVGYRQANGLQLLGDFARLLGLHGAVRRHARRSVGRCKAYGKAEGACGQQCSERPRRTTILSHVTSL